MPPSRSLGSVSRQALRPSGACHLCGERDATVVDHRHDDPATGDGPVRALLCDGCNVLCQRPERLRAALALVEATPIGPMYSEARRERHRERNSAWRRTYRERHPERVAEQDRRGLAAHRARYASDPEFRARQVEYSRAYRARKREERNAT